MSWSNLLSNQGVTFNNLQDAVNNGVFTAKTSIPSSQKLINKSEANTYVYIDTSYPPYLAKSSGELVVKGDLQSAPPTTTTTTTPFTPIYSTRIYGVNDYSTNYLSVPSNGELVYSDDGGLSWTGKSITSYSVARNDTGQYVLSGYGSSVQVSNNYGATFSNVTLPSNTDGVTGTAMSNSGQYMFVITYGGADYNPRIYKSSDYGASFVLVYTYVYVTPSSTIEAPPYPKIAVSGNGQYVTAIVNTRPSSFSWGSRLLISTNGGSTFTASAQIANRYYTDVAFNSTGEYQILTRMSSYGTGNILGQGSIVISSTYSVTFPQQIYEENLRALYCAISSTGQYMLAAFISTNNSTNKFYYSTNYGVAWSSFDTNPPLPGIGATPGGVFISPTGSYALITYVDTAQITYTTNWSTWTTQNISGTYKFGGLSKSR